MILEREALRRAAEIIGERGWTQGMLEDETGAVCAQGATHYASAELGVNQFVVNEMLHQYLAGLGFHGPVSWWNDDTCKNAEDVILALKCAAEAPL